MRKSGISRRPEPDDPKKDGKNGGIDSLSGYYEPVRE